LKIRAGKSVPVEAETEAGEARHPKGLEGGAADGVAGVKEVLNSEEEVEAAPERAGGGEVEEGEAGEGE
jgi:hypothetical protein